MDNVWKVDYVETSTAIIIRGSSRNLSHLEGESFEPFTVPTLLDETLKLFSL